MYKVYKSYKDYFNWVYKLSGFDEKSVKTYLEVNSERKDPFFPCHFKITDEVKEGLSLEEARRVFIDAIYVNANAELTAESTCSTLIFTFPWEYQGRELYIDIQYRECGDKIQLRGGVGREDLNPLYVSGDWFDLNPSNMKHTFDKTFTDLKSLTLDLRRYEIEESCEDDDE
tara:strand:- start:1275 stop:1790 length:516 start_codon:yes stop_codon:yes gene_type:complete